MSRRKALILDTSAFIAGFDPFAVADEIYSVPAVEKELTKSALHKLRFEAAVESGKLRILEPSSHYQRMAKEKSKEAGDINFLSEVDMDVLALAMQLKEEGAQTTIVTDDYSIQNVAQKINIEFAPLTTLGIRFYLQWQRYCPACRKKYPPDYGANICEICGTRLKRKPLTKKQIEKDQKKPTQKKMHPE
jgi:UPF0271 protein